MASRNKSEWNISRPVGTRFPQDIRRKIDRYLSDKLQEKETDSVQDTIYKKSVQQRISDFCDYYYADYPYYDNRTIYKKMSILLFTETIEDYLSVSDISGKTFFEMCLEENSDIASPDDEGWTTISWPTKEQEIMCGILDSSPLKKQQLIQKMIRSLLPEYYHQFMNSLLSDEIPDEEEPDNIVRYQVIDNFGCRMRLTLDYLRIETGEIPLTVCKVNGLYYYPVTAAKRKYIWHVLRLGDIWKFCQIFKLSPHWVLFGNKPVAVLAKYAQTELIMDEFSFLPKDLQKYVIEASGNIFRRPF